MRLCWLMGLLVLVATPFSASVAFAQFEEQGVLFDRDGNKIPDREVNSDRVNWEILRDAENARFRGIGLVDFGMGGGCTGTLIRTPGGVLDGPAYILTNGHCTGGTLMGNNDVYVDRPAPRSMVMRFRYFQDAGEHVVSVPIVRYSYATMSGTDVAVMQVAATLRELLSQGLTAFPIATIDPSEGTAVEMVGVPQTGVIRAQRFLRRSTCSIGGRVDLEEGGYHFRGAVRHGCSSIGGSSGTSMISRERGEIVAINNTGVSDRAAGSPECAIDRPCEVGSDGSVTTNFVVNYAQRVTDIPSCFRGDGVFDVSVPGCRLRVNR